MSNSNSALPQDIELVVSGGGIVVTQTRPITQASNENRSTTNMARALLVVDFINEIVHPEGALARKGYARFIAEHNTFKHLNTAIGAFRKTGDPVVFVRLAFDKDYTDQPKSSPLLGRANKLGILMNGTWSTEINDAVDYNEDDLTIIKTRVSAFFNTSLSGVLRPVSGTTEVITDLYITGVATDLAVESTALDAHDRDFGVHIVTDACAAANDDYHSNSLRALSRITQLVTAANL